jgi:DNA-binding NarL/FixJ family response regulator
MIEPALLTQPAAVRAILVDDQLLLREGLTRVLTMHGVEVVASLGAASGLKEHVRALHPDIVLLDIRLPPTFTDEGLRAAKAIRLAYPGIPVLLLSQYVELLYLDELLSDRLGGIGYLIKDRVFDDLDFVATIHSIVGGATVVDPGVVIALMQRQSNRAVLERLTPREREVLSRMAEGDSNSRIAAQLFITEKAVAKHINGLLAKLDLPPEAEGSRRVHAVLAYLRGDR